MKLRNLVAMTLLILIGLLGTTAFASSKTSAIKVNNLKYVVNQGNYFKFPTKVTAIMSNGSKKSVSITWSSKKIDTYQVGTYTFSGKVRGYKSKVNMTVIVKYPYMSDAIKPFGQVKTNASINRSMDMAGKRYNKGYQLYFSSSSDNGYTSFNLGGNYSSISGLIGLDDDNNYDKDQYTTINFIGDGVIIKSYKFGIGDLPQDLDLDVSGVKKLTVEIVSDWYWSIVDLTNVKLEK